MLCMHACVCVRIETMHVNGVWFVPPSKFRSAHTIEHRWYWATLIEGVAQGPTEPLGRFDPVPSALQADRPNQSATLPLCVYLSYATWSFIVVNYTEICEFDNRRSVFVIFCCVSFQGSKGEPGKLVGLPLFLSTRALIILSHLHRSIACRSILR